MDMRCPLQQLPKLRMHETMAVLTIVRHASVSVGVDMVKRDKIILSLFYGFLVVMKYFEACRGFSINNF